MQKKLRRLLAVLLAVCMTLTTLSIPAFAANGTASLSDTTMTESGSITVNFSQTATSSAYYKIEIKSSDYRSTYLNETVTSGDTYTISTETVSELSAGNTYYIYIGYWEGNSWKSTAYEGTFTVTADSTSTPTYTLELTVDDSNPSIDDTVTVTATIYADGSAVSGIPDGYKLSIWYQHNNGWVNVLTDSTSNTSGTISVSSSNFSDGSTYTVYGGLYTTGGETTATADVEFTVGTASGATGNYYVEISIEDDDKYQETYNDGTTITGSYVYSSTDTVNVKVVLMDGDTEKEVESFPSGYSVYVWFEDDAKDENELEYTTSDTTITDTITISSYTFTEGNNYNVYARINYNDVEISGTMVSTSFTIETTYGIELSLNSVTTDYQEFSVGDVLSTGFTVTTNVNGGSGTTSTDTPTGTYVTIYYQDDTGWHDLVYRLGSKIYSDGFGSNPEDLTLSSGSFSEGSTYTVYIELYNEGGAKLAYDTIIFTIPVRASFYTRTLTLDGAVAVNYYVDMTGVTDPENYSVVFSGTGITTQTATYNSGSYRDDFNGDTKYYRFTLELDSTQMALTFDAVLTYNGTTEVQTDSGYSVEKYCKSAITGGWLEAGVCAALLNYGGYSQTYFSTTGSLANANLSTYDESWSDPVSTWAEDVSEYVATVSNLPSEITGQALALVLESETVIRLYFNADASSVDNLTFTVDDTELTIKEASSGSYSYYVEFSVQASRLNETFTVTVTNGTDTGTVEYSAYAYINTVVNGSYDTKLQNVCKALYYYAEAADDYSNWYTGTT